MSQDYGDLEQLIDRTADTRRNVVITGAGSSLGSHFLFWKLQMEGKIFLIDSKVKDQKRRENITRKMKKVAYSYGISYLFDEEFEEKVSMISSDLSLPLGGLPGTEISKLRNNSIDEFWHLDGLHERGWKNREAYIKRNVEATRNALYMAKLVGCKHFIFLSSADSIGDYSGQVGEDLHKRQTSSNDAYDWSLNKAEHQVADFCRTNNMKYTILRPSTIIGPLATYRAEGQELGPFKVICDLHDARKILNEAKQPVVVDSDPGSCINVIPVDQVVYDMLHLSSIGFGDQKVYHLTNTDFVIKAAMGVAMDQAGIKNIEFDLRGSGYKTSSIDKMIHEHMARYHPCFHSHKTFTRSLPEHRELTLRDLERYFGNYICQLKKHEAQKVVGSDIEHDGMIQHKRPDTMQVKGFNPDSRVLSWVNTQELKTIDLGEQTLM